MKGQHACSINEEIPREVVKHLSSHIVAAARRLVLLRRIEWSGLTGRGTEDDPFRAACPECRNSQQDGHTDECELGGEIAP